MTKNTYEVKRRRKVLHGWPDDRVDMAESRSGHRRAYNPLEQLFNALVDLLAQLIKRFFNWLLDLLEQLIDRAVKAILDKLEEPRKRLAERTRQFGQQLKRLVQRP